MSDKSPSSARRSPRAPSSGPRDLGFAPPRPEEDPDEGFVRDLYYALLGRPPDPAGLATHYEALRSGRSPIEVFRGFLDSEEFKRRRAALLDDGCPRAALAGSSAGEGPLDLQVVIPTAQGASKVRTLVAALTEENPLRRVVSVLDGSSREPDRALYDGDARVEVHWFPGDSVFHLRARLPTVARGARWVALLEDHNRIDRTWLGAVSDALRSAGPEERAFTGPVANRTSQGRWSWASFLHTFALNWELGHRFRMSPLATNIVFNRDLLGDRPFRLGHFETSLLPRLFESARFRPDLVLDHVQDGDFRRATSLHFHNSRTLAAFIRAQPASLDLRLPQLVRTTLRDRFEELRHATQGHPMAASLPRGTWLRVRWLTLAHAAGLVLGWCFGMGRSPWKVE